MGTNRNICRDGDLLRAVTTSNAIETPPNNRGVLRSTALGAVFLAVVTAPGTCYYLYQWIASGNAFHLGEALALFSTASFMGGSGGAAYHLVIHSRIKSSWKPFVAALAAIEAYLLAFSLPALVIGLLSPKLTEGIPLGDVVFWLLLIGYGPILCSVAFGFAHAPRIAQVTVGGVGLVTILGLVAMLVVLQRIGPDDLDLWFAFLKPLYVMIQLLLIAFVVVSIIGWVRQARKRADPPSP